MYHIRVRVHFVDGNILEVDWYGSPLDMNTPVLLKSLFPFQKVVTMYEVFFEEEISLLDEIQVNWDMSSVCLQFRDKVRWIHREMRREE